MKMELLNCLCPLITYGSIICLLLVFLVTVVIKLVTQPYPVVERYTEEEVYTDLKTGEKMKFSKLSDPNSVHLSVVVPAFNEEERLPPMLDEALDFLEKRQKQYRDYTYEIIVVSDGSKDKTVKVTESYSFKYGCDKVKCLTLIKNRGKGGAVRLGIQSARGAIILFADADGASKFEDLVKLEKALEDLTTINPLVELDKISSKLAIVVGSRAHLQEESLAKRNVFRNILMYGFHFLVWLFAVRGIKDTQCGFKLFTRKAAKICFENLHVNRWAFDVELLYIAQKLNIPIAEIPVKWTEIDGSKVTPIVSWIQMGLDLSLIWLKYKTGAWKLKITKID